MKKTTLATALGIIIGGASMGANAALTSTNTLNFTQGGQGTTACNYGTTPPCAKNGYNITDIVGSYFTMDTNGSGTIEIAEKNPIGSNNGIVLGTTQLASGSHSGSVNGSESPNIDNPWEFFGGTGMHQTISSTLVNGAFDLSGWNVTWNGIASIPLVGNATIICDGNNEAACGIGSTYVVDGAYHVGGAGFTTVGYTVHLEGTVAAAIPVPAAVWLFGSGLLGLAGVARRKRK